MMRFILSFFLCINILLLWAQNMPEREPGFRYPDKMRIYDSVMAAAVPEIKILPGMLKSSLPDIVDNSHNSCFSGILDQRSFFSCQQYAGVAYTYAYEENRLRDLDGTLPENLYSTHYTW